MDKKKIVLLMAGLTAVIAILALSMNINLVDLCKNGFNVENIKNYLLSYGNWAVFALLAIFAFKPLLVVTPISVPAIVSGLLFGPVLGSIYTLIGAFLSASTGFIMAKYLGNGFIGTILRKKGAKIDGDLDKHGFKIILLLRLSMIFPYDPLTYAAGFSKMKYRHFILGTLIGFAPEMIAYNVIGTSIEDIFSKKTVFAIGVILILVLITMYFRAKRAKSVQNEMTDKK